MITHGLGNANPYSINTDRRLKVGDRLFHRGGTYLTDQDVIIFAVEVDFEDSSYPYQFVAAENVNGPTYWGIGGNLSLHVSAASAGPVEKEEDETPDYIYQSNGKFFRTLKAAFAYSDFVQRHAVEV
jgi:hypothetical protein